MFAAKVDLHHAYFHLDLSPKIEEYVTLEVGDDLYQFQSACFGLNTLPQIWMSLMKFFLNKWRKEALMVFIHLDDILFFREKPTVKSKTI